VISGSKPWEVDRLAPLCRLDTFTVEEQRHLDEFYKETIKQHKRDQLTTELTKILTGEQVDSLLYNNITSLGADKVAKTGSAQILKNPYMNASQVDAMVRMKEQFYYEQAKQNVIDEMQKKCPPLLYDDRDHP
jgi:hypothetical protein